MEIEKLDLNNYKYLYDLMKHDTTSKIEWYTQFKNIYFRSEDNELLIRDNSDDGINSVTLAVIELNHRHQGYGTKIITWLESYARQHHAKKVIIESIITKPMRNLAIKLGYVKCKYNTGSYEKLMEDD